MPTNYYLIKIENDVEPYVYDGFKNDDEVLQAARAHRANDIEMEDGLYRAWVTDGVLTMDSFSGRELRSY